MNLEQIKTAISGHELETVMPDNPRFTSVLIPLVEVDGRLHVLFEVRSEEVDQPGEVSFPGGHVEAGESALEAAVRETCEELLVTRNQVEVLAPMHRLADRGRLVIDSFLGVLHGYQGSFLAKEVARVFTVPLEWLLEKDPEIHTAEMEFYGGDEFPYDLIPGGRNYPFIRVPRRFFFYHADEIIWGLTGELLYRAVQLLRRQMGLPEPEAGKAGIPGKQEPGNQ